MVLDLQSLVPQPSNWFLPTIEYEGHGEAQFSDPSVLLEGRTIIRFSEDGQPSISMYLDSIPPNFDLNELFYWPSNMGSMKMYVPKRQNSPCTKFEVQTLDGNFRLYGRISYSYDQEAGCLNLSTWGHSPRSQFDAIHAKPAKYWVMPLVNYVPELAIDLHHTQSHPLRICPTPAIPEGLSPEELHRAVWTAHSRNALIVFQFNGQPGFIELLPDFETRQATLLKGQERTTTAVMIGEIGSETIDFDDVDNWFPFNFLSLLGFTIGTTVGATGIEFRDEEVHLVRRIHAFIEDAAFTKHTRHQAIREMLHAGTGPLLTAFADFTAHGNQERLHLGKAIAQLARCGLYDRGMNDTILYICRSLDVLYDGHVQQGNISFDSVANHLQDVYTDIFNLQQSAVNLVQRKREKAQKESAADPASQDKQNKTIALQRIEGYVSNILNLRIQEAGEFGSKAAILLDKYGFPDAAIMEKHYRANPQRYGQRTWLGDLSHLRNRLAHGGTISIRNDKELEDAAWIMRHLHDITTRIALHILGYTGKYQPTVLDGNDPQTIDWVKDHFTAAELGYQ